MFIQVFAQIVNSVLLIAKINLFLIFCRLILKKSKNLGVIAYFTYKKTLKSYNNECVFNK